MKALEKLKEVTALLEKEVADVNLKLSETYPKIAQLVEYPSTNKYFIDIGNHKISIGNSYDYYKFKDGWGQDREPTVEQVEDRYNKLLALLEEYKRDCAMIEKENEVVIANNKKVHEIVKTTMAEMGFKSSVRVRDTKSRSAYPKYKDENAGFITDLLNQCPTGQYNPSNSADYQYKQRIIDGYKVAMAAIKDRAVKKEQEEKAKKELHEIALLRAKYTPDNPHSEVQDIVQELLKKNKYLRLGYYLEKNRNDWTDGYFYASTGLTQFETETELDKEIYENIKSKIENWGGDGRCFRDCEYNYGVLYTYCKDIELVADFEKLKGLENDY